MASLLSQSTSNSKIQLAATAVVSAAVAAGAVLSYQRLQQGERVSRLKQSIPSPHDHEPAPKVRASALRDLLTVLFANKMPYTR